MDIIVRRNQSKQLFPWLKEQTISQQMIFKKSSTIYRYFVQIN
jgi:hypothetical protein